MPNLLYIHSDQHCAAVLGCYGEASVCTPHLDALAARGVRFTGAYCASPLCVPARMAMLTGLRPHQTGVWCNDNVLNSGVPTLAHALGAAGLQPVLAGRMHSVGPDQHRGYTERWVGDHNENFIGGPAAGRGALAGGAGPQAAAIEKSGIGQSGYEVHDEAVTAAALRYLQDWAARPAAGRPPFCLTVGYMLPHPPFVARAADFARYAGRVPPPRVREPFAAVSHPYLRWWRSRCGLQERSPAEIDRCRTAYWALVDRLDHQIGRLLNFLDAAGLAEDTLVIYTSDHGEMAGEHDLWFKHVFYEDSVRVPLLISWPRRVPAGVVRAEVVDATDVTATLLDLMGAPALPESPGRTLQPLLQTGSATWESVALAEYCNDEEFAPPGGCCQRMIRREDWKLIVYDDQPSQLFNLRDDPEERHDRSADPTCVSLSRELHQQVSAGWNPEHIRPALRARRRRADLLAAWARHTCPADTLRWTMTDAMNRLDKAEPGTASILP